MELRITVGFTSPKDKREEILNTIYKTRILRKLLQSNGIHCKRPSEYTYRVFRGDVIVDIDHIFTIPELGTTCIVSKGQRVWIPRKYIHSISIFN